MILVGGEALIDVFATTAMAAETPLRARVGGSPFNVAVGLARLGQPVAFLGALSHDFFGQGLARALVEEGVDVSAVQRNDARTTLGVVALDAAGVPAYAFYGDGGADRQLTLAALAALPAGLGAVQVGSFSCVVEPVASTLRELVQRAGPLGTLVAYDPNVRLNVEPALSRWRDALAWMLPRAGLLKISEEDLQLLQPGTSPSRFLDDALAAGAALAVVTRGAQGAVARSRGAPVAVEVAALPTAVVDTVGAGDSFQAALLAWLAEHGALTVGALGRLGAAELEAALAFAMRAAAWTCGRRGADLPRRDALG